MKKYINFIIIFILFSIPSFSQNIIKHDNDTMIVISPKQVDVINTLIIDFENTKKNTELYKKIIEVDSLSLIKKDSIIYVQGLMFNKKEGYYRDSIKRLEDSIKKEKRKKNLTNCVLGGIAVVLGVLFIVK